MLGVEVHEQRHFFGAERKRWCGHLRAVRGRLTRCGWGADKLARGRRLRTGRVCHPMLLHVSVCICRGRDGYCQQKESHQQPHGARADCQPRALPLRRRRPSSAVTTLCAYSNVTGLAAARWTGARADRGSWGGFRRRRRSRACVGPAPAPPRRHAGLSTLGSHLDPGRARTRSATRRVRTRA